MACILKMEGDCPFFKIRLKGEIRFVVLGHQVLSIEK